MAPIPWARRPPPCPGSVSAALGDGAGTDAARTANVRCQQPKELAGRPGSAAPPLFWQRRVRPSCGAAAHYTLRIANSRLIWESRCGNGIQITPADNADKCCSRGAMRAACATLTCPRYSSVSTLRHNHLNKAWRDAARYSGVALAMEPELHEMHMQPPRTRPRGHARRRIAGHAGR